MDQFQCLRIVVLIGTKSTHTYHKKQYLRQVYCVWRMCWYNLITYERCAPPPQGPQHQRVALARVCSLGDVPNMIRCNEVFDEELPESDYYQTRDLTIPCPMCEQDFIFAKLRPNPGNGSGGGVVQKPTRCQRFKDKFKSSSSGTTSGNAGT
ncbi:hypothetical protein BELL_0233g00010 [Botrytis elliptica]|uniref:Uncharacterized protein n=1 Tax=Botrytis elliptica TaxID=278938 RepID=A0A4Z1JMX6_9HELO|nr:hypothetical protein BELL_0233g00010 [Botrytis elliptica]